LRRSRASFDEIGRELGISRQRAWRIYQAALRQIPAASVGDHRVEELALIDDATRDLLLVAKDPSNLLRYRIEAWNGVCRWAERKARLLGLDAPAKRAIEVITQDVVEAEIARLEAELAAHDAEAAARPALASGSTGTREIT